MNADDLSKYQGMLAERNRILDFLRITKEPACIVVHVPRWVDLENRNPFPGEASAGVFIEDKSEMAIIIEQSRKSALAQIKRIETELTANGITFPVAA